MKYILLLVFAFLAVTYFTDRDSRNESYALQYFAEKTGVEDVIASKRLHDETDGWRGCLFAVVRFSDEFAVKVRSGGPSTVTAPKASANRMQRLLRWPADTEWRATPLPPQSAHDEDAFLSCNDRLEPEQVTELNAILSKPGSWAVRSWSRVVVLSADARLAAIFRYGD